MGGFWRKRILKTSIYLLCFCPDVIVQCAPFYHQISQICHQIYFQFLEKYQQHTQDFTCTDVSKLSMHKLRKAISVLPLMFFCGDEDENLEPG